MTAIRVGSLTAALLFVAGAVEAQQPRSDRDGVLDGRIPVITDSRGRVSRDCRYDRTSTAAGVILGRRTSDRDVDCRVEGGRVVDPRIFARERDKCERHAARANWWRLRGGRNAEKHAQHEARKAERCFDRLFAKQEKRSVRDARRDDDDRDDAFGIGDRGRRSDNNGVRTIARGNGKARGRGKR
jgi:hypothetical protein